MPYPWVTDVTVKNNQIVLTVKIEGFTTGERLELSGYATQDGGGFAVFNGLQVVPAPTPDNKITMYVTSVSSQNFQNGSPVTVVLRAARVWVSVLKESQSGQKPGRVYTGLAQPGQQHPAAEGTTWNDVITAENPAAPSGGNVDEASTGSEDSFQAD
jgi:hypothetical protein